MFVNSKHEQNRKINMCNNIIRECIICKDVCWMVETNFNPFLHKFNNMQVTYVYHLSSSLLWSKMTSKYIDKHWFHVFSSSQGNWRLLILVNALFSRQSSAIELTLHHPHCGNESPMRRQPMKFSSKCYRTCHLWFHVITIFKCSTPDTSCDTCQLWIK